MRDEKHMKRIVLVVGMIVCGVAPLVASDPAEAPLDCFSAFLAQVHSGALTSSEFNAWFDAHSALALAARDSCGNTLLGAVMRLLVVQGDTWNPARAAATARLIEVARHLLSRIPAGFPDLNKAIFLKHRPYSVTGEQLTDWYESIVYCAIDSAYRVGAFELMSDIGLKVTQEACSSCEIDQIFHQIMLDVFYVSPIDPRDFLCAIIGAFPWLLVIRDLDNHTLEEYLAQEIPLSKCPWMPEIFSELRASLGPSA